jgi:hypothetical protein
MSVIVKYKKSKEESHELVLPDDIVGAAEAYLDAGLQPVPLHKGGAPVDGFTHSTIKAITHDDVAKWFSKAKGIALRCGTDGGGTIVFDLDCPEARELAPRLLPQTGLIWGRNADRAHYAYRLEPGVALLKQEFPKITKSTKALVEILGEGKTGTANLCTAPPSIKPNNGDPVTFASAKLPLPTISAADACKGGAMLATASFLLRHYPEKGSRHPYSVAAYGALWNAGWTRGDALTVNKAVSKAAGDEEDRSGDVHSAYDQGNAGGNVTGWPTFSEWLDDDAAAAEEVARRAGEQMKPNEPQIGLPGLLEAAVLPVAKWAKLDIPDPDPQVEGLIWAGTINMLFGREGTGKSLLGLYLGKCLSKGLPFFHFEVPKLRRVLYLDAETPMPMLKQRVNSIVPSPHPNFTLFSMRYWQGLGGPYLNFDNEEIRKLLGDYIAKHKPDLVIVDTATSFVQGTDINIPLGWQEPYAWMKEFAAQGRAFLWIGHEAKTKGSAGTPIGATYQLQQCDTVMHVEQPLQDMSSYTVTPKKVHFAKLPKPFSYELFEIDDGAPGLAPCDTVPKVDQLTRMILFKLADGWTGSGNALAKALGKAQSTVHKKLNSMKDKGLLIDFGGLEITSNGVGLAKKLGWKKTASDD